MISRFLPILFLSAYVDSCGTNMRQNSREAKILLKQGLGDAYNGESVSSYLNDQPEWHFSYYGGHYIELAFAASIKLRADIYVKLTDLDVARQNRIPSDTDAEEVLRKSYDMTGYTESYLFFISDIAERVMPVDTDMILDLLLIDMEQRKSGPEEWIATYDAILANESMANAIKNIADIGGSFYAFLLTAWEGFEGFDSKTFKIKRT